MRILLVDDHALFAKSLEIALEGNEKIEKISTLTDLSSVFPTIESEKPDIILLDINLSNISSVDGLELAKKILSERPQEKIVILTGYDLPVYQYEARNIGTKGFINKNTEPDKLIKILSDIIEGKTYFPSETVLLEELTESEEQILQYLCDGKKRSEIAKELYLSERTVSNHLQHIFDKLGVNSSLEAVTKGIKLGYVKPLDNK